ncbi:DUF4192 family protein [Cellulomonas sp. APG4]|uniref:DUF4192 family protein n=1 Tax=Cellulomonas sp. APG4 TaxID=1538656 RepID=UPI00137AB78E|nr:DUF4192 family protein [Cellulomonas sp. APG4]NCT90015.1 DUF4192 family protein [Cellulomonas sp. APG4]
MTITTRDVRELLSLIPFQLGFRPEESVALLSLRGSRGSTGLVARVDLADLADADDGARVARQLVHHLVEDGARRLLVAVYSERATGPVPDPDVARAVDVVREAADHFVDDVGVWAVGTQVFHEHGCTEPGCRDALPRSVHELESTEVSARMVALGASVATSRDSLRVADTATATARRSARRARSRWAARGLGARSEDDVRRWRRDGLEVWAHELDRATAEVGGAVARGVATGEGSGRGPHGWAPPAAVVLGRLQAALDDVLVRDAVLLRLVPGTERLGERVVAGDAGPEVGAALQVIVDPVRGRRPEEARVAGARALLGAVSAHAARGTHVPSVTLLGVLAWWEGDGARAAVLLEQALAEDPGHRLARLVQEAIDHGMPPGWLRRGVPA